MVTMNDTFALLGGKFFGKTPLWSLSPKKTVEGFIAGFFGSLIVALIFGVFSNFDFMLPLLCPQPKFTLMPFVFPQCERPYLY